MRRKIKADGCAGSGKLPDQESWNSIIQFSDSGVTKGILKAGHVLVFNNENMTYLGDSIRVDFFNDSRESYKLSNR